MKQEESYILSLDDEKGGFFFDSYALFEIMKGSPNYMPYSEFEITTCKLNIFELVHGFLRDKQAELAEIALKKYYSFAVDFDGDVIVAAAKLKILLNKRNVSMADCIGYALAKQLGVKFLTGDREFQGMDNVEFVK